MIAVTFDFGQTLGELDYDFLGTRLAEREARFVPARARAATQTAWEVYGQRKSEGHASAWRHMIETLLRAGEVPTARLEELSDWLWREQPKQNLWRRPIVGMIELVRELGAAGVPVGILSNSEGRLAELVAELDWAQDFEVVVDSGKLGIDKPDPRIFRHACSALGVPEANLIHVGDSWEADVLGALGAGASAIWFDRESGRRALPERVWRAENAAEVRAVLAQGGVLGP